MVSFKWTNSQQKNSKHGTFDFSVGSLVRESKLLSITFFFLFNYCN